MLMMLLVVLAGGGGGVGNIYSTEEVEIGTWIDGKPLYRKVAVGVLPNSTYSTLVIDFGTLQINPTYIGGTIFDSGDLAYPLNSAGVCHPNGVDILPVSLYFSRYRQTTDLTYGLFIKINNVDFYNQPYTVVIEYTKP